MKLTVPEEDIVSPTVTGILLVFEDVREPIPDSCNNAAIVIGEKIVIFTQWCNNDVPNGFVNKVGLLCMLNLDYPKSWKYTLEMIQSLFMGTGSVGRMVEEDICEFVPEEAFSFFCHLSNALCSERKINV